MRCTQIFALNLLLLGCTGGGGGDPAVPKSAPGSALTEPEQVTLTLDSAQIESGEGDLLVELQLRLDNRTGEVIEVRTNFFSPFDGLWLEARRPGGEPWVRVGYTHHQSPLAQDGSQLLPPGITADRIVFPVSELALETGPIEVRLTGGLPGTEFTALETAWVRAGR